MLVHDLTGTVTFYSDVLGFEVVVPPNGAPWALLRHGDIELFLQPVAEALCTLNAPLPTHTRDLVTVRMQVPDVVSYYERVRGRVEVVQELQTAPGNTEFSIRDCNGFFVTFVEAERN